MKWVKNVKFFKKSLMKDKYRNRNDVENDDVRIEGFKVFLD